MYWKSFQLSTDPFGITPDPKFLYLSQAHASAIEWMKMAIEQKEFGIITGEVGSGKTVISRYLIDSLSSNDKYKICWIVNSNLSSIELLREIYLQLFEEEPPTRRNAVIKKLEEGLTKYYLENKFPIVFIDEAQAIPGKKTIEEIRLLCNYQTDEQNLISIILLGQPEFAAKLKNKNYRAFLQRVRFTITLNPLTRDETKEYINHRLKVAGANSADIFSEKAIDEIYRLTNGYPRPINHLASLGMMAALSKDKLTVDAEDILEAAKSTLYFEDKAKNGS